MDPQLLQLLTVASIPIGLISVAIGIYLTGRLIKEGIDDIRVEIKEGIKVMAEVVKSIHEDIQRSQRKLEAEVRKVKGVAVIRESGKGGISLIEGIYSHDISRSS